MKIMVTLFFLVQQVWAQDCADCGAKSLPVPLADTAKEGLAIVEKLASPEKPDEKICEAVNACNVIVKEEAILDSLKYYEEAKDKLVKDLEKMKFTVSVFDEHLKNLTTTDPKISVIQKSRQKYLDKIGPAASAIEGLEKMITQLNGNVSKEVSKDCNSYNSYSTMIKQQLNSTGSGTCGLDEGELKTLLHFFYAGRECLMKKGASSEKYSQHMKYYAEAVEKAFKKIPSYEGFVNSPYFSETGEKFSNKVGETFSFKRYSNGLAQYYPYGSQEFFHIYTKTGKYSSMFNFGQSLILLKPETKYKVLTSTTVGTKTFHLLREIEEGEDPASTEKLDKELIAAAEKNIVSAGTILDKEANYLCPLDPNEKSVTTIKQKIAPVFYYKQ